MYNSVYRQCVVGLSTWWSAQVLQTQGLLTTTWRLFYNLVEWANYHLPMVNLKLIHMENWYNIQLQLDSDLNPVPVMILNFLFFGWALVFASNLVSLSWTFILMYSLQRALIHFAFLRVQFLKHRFFHRNLTEQEHLSCFSHTLSLFLGLQIHKSRTCTWCPLRTGQIW